jgi:hypothetical protein
MTKSHDSTKQQQLECDDVASSLFLSTTSTVPNALILFAILYARAFLSAVCGKRCPWISRCCRPLSDCPTNLKAMMWHLLSFFPQHSLYQMLQFFLLSCMLGYCFQLCATNDSLVSRFHRPLSDCPTNLKAMMWHLLFFFHIIYCTKCFSSF